MRTDYYVYLHKRKDNGEVFYVGKGRGNRAWHFHARSKSWHNIADWCGVDVEIVKNNLTNEQAIAEENLEILKYSTLVNKRSSSGIMPMDYSKISEYFKYDETSCTFLRWKKYYCKDKPKFARQVGDIAGKFNKRGYVEVFLDGVTYKAHRVIFLLLNKDFDQSLVINHIDNNPSNNNISNLEAVTQKENSNRTIVQKEGNERNKFGELGIFLKENFNDSYFGFAWKDEDGNKRTKHFSIKLNGYEGALELAKNFKYAFLERNK